MRLIQEFREFALRGNVIDLAVAVIIGAAFGKITASLVNDILMPPIGLLLGGVDFSELFVTLGPGDYATLAEAQAAGAATLNYGLFINAVVHFTIIAGAMFAVVRQINWLKERNETPDAPTPDAPTLVPETKNCAFCISIIPAAASRCPYCTSVLETEPGE
nr:large-conductance mechanosensitive channel protein MscL [Rhodovibrio sodomensis]